MASDTKKCSHAPCSCIPADGKKYCSQTCEDSAGITALGCDCGHPGCSGEKI